MEPREISPQDSLSRQLAQSVTPDTIVSHLAYTGTDDRKLEWPRTVLLDDQGNVYAGDTKRHTVFVFELDGQLRHEFLWPEAMFPYLIGWRGDTLLVFTPGQPVSNVNYVLDSVRVRSFAIPPVEAGTLQYATATDSLVFLKAVTKADTHALWQMDHFGNVEKETQLTGASWHHAGFLRAYDDGLYSLTGFFPQITLWPDSLTGSSSTFSLRGFDSPMLRRTWAYTQGSERGAPLLTSSADRAGDYWFVLNLRPGWLQIDVYDAGGDLQTILIEQDPGYRKEFYPLDIAVRQLEPNTYDMVVGLIAGDPVVRRYTWVSELP